VEKGLSDGDTVITTNFYRLQPNVKVKPEAQPVAANESTGRT
jgi:hypothetical protein